MKVIRYTFDVCIGQYCDKDCYSMATRIAEAIKRVDGVCGCEAKGSHSDIANCVKVDEVMARQNAERKSGGAA